VTTINSSFSTALGGVVGEAPGSAFLIDHTDSTLTVHCTLQCIEVGGVAGIGDNLRLSRVAAHVTMDAAGTATLSVVGGLLGGASAANIQDSYADGRIEVGDLAGGPVGGLVGRAEQTLIAMARTYSNVAISNNTGNCDTITGGKAGLALLQCGSGCPPPNIVSSYWNLTLSTCSGTDPGATGLTDAQAKMSSSYVGWDFTNVWTQAAGGYPTLR
jgi:hypothetical protein